MESFSSQLKPCPTQILQDLVGKVVNKLKKEVAKFHPDKWEVSHVSKSSTG